MTTPEREEHIQDLRDLLEDQDLRLQIHQIQSFDQAWSKTAYLRRGVKIRRRIATLKLAIEMMEKQE